jgi:hypothetical protein
VTRPDGTHETTWDLRHGGRLTITSDPLLPAPYPSAAEYHDHREQLEEEAELAIALPGLRFERLLSFPRRIPEDDEDGAGHHDEDESAA